MAGNGAAADPGRPISPTGARGARVLSPLTGPGSPAAVPRAERRAHSNFRSRRAMRRPTGFHPVPSGLGGSRGAARADRAHEPDAGGHRVVVAGAALSPADGVADAGPGRRCSRTRARARWRGSGWCGRGAGGDRADGECHAASSRPDRAGAGRRRAATEGQVAPGAKSGQGEGRPPRRAGAGQMGARRPRQVRSGRRPRGVGPDRRGVPTDRRRGRETGSRSVPRSPGRDAAAGPGWSGRRPTRALLARPGR